MNVYDGELPEVKIIEPKLFGDERGFLLETYSTARYAQAGIAPAFVQDNLSRSRRGILRGLHLQQPFPQGKLVYCVEGEVFDVAVDVRLGSPRFGRWMGVTLPAAKRQVYVPAGFAHGFCVTSDYAVVAYKCTETYHPETEMGVLWSDPDVGIEWPLSDVTVSDRDRGLPRLRDIPRDKLPRFDRSA